MKPDQNGKTSPAIRGTTMDKQQAMREFEEWRIQQDNAQLRSETAWQTINRAYIAGYQAAIMPALQIDTKPLQATTREEAQAEAITVVKQRLAKYMSNFFKIRGNAS